MILEEKSRNSEKKKKGSPTTQGGIVELWILI